MKLIDLTGKVFGNWLVLKRADTLYDNKQASWICECQCGSGKQKIIAGSSLSNGDSTGCGCNNPQRLRPFEALFNRMKRDNESLRKLEFTLTYEDFLSFTTQDKCLYCNHPVEWKEFNASGYGYNIDRKDNSKGYILDNCVVCCKRCNMGKRDTFSFEEWFGMTEYFRRNI